MKKEPTTFEFTMSIHAVMNKVNIFFPAAMKPRSNKKETKQIPSKFQLYLTIGTVFDLLLHSLNKATPSLYTYLPAILLYHSELLWKCLPTGQHVWHVLCLSLYVCHHLLISSVCEHLLLRLSLLLFVSACATLQLRRLLFVVDIVHLIISWCSETDSPSLRLAVEATCGLWLLLQVSAESAQEKGAQQQRKVLRPGSGSGIITGTGAAWSTLDKVLSRLESPVIYLNEGGQDAVYKNVAADELLRQFGVGTLEDFMSRTWVRSCKLPLNGYLPALLETPPLTEFDCVLHEDCSFRVSTDASRFNPEAGLEPLLQIAIFRKVGCKDAVLQITHIKRRSEDPLNPSCDLGLRMMLVKTFSHDIRTPLNGLINFVDQLQDVSSVPPPLSLPLTMIKQNSKAVLLKSEDLLDLLHILEGQFEVRKVPFDLQTFIAELKTTASSQHECGENGSPDSRDSLKVKLGEGVPKQLMADRSRLFRVLLHLVQNGYKYRRSDCHVQVNIEYNFMTQELEFEVADTGLGISERKLSELRKMLENNDLRACGGGRGEEADVGLSLYTSAKICEKIASSLQLRTIEGHGTSFSFRMKQPLKSRSMRMLISRSSNGLRSPQLHGIGVSRFARFGRAHQPAQSEREPDGEGESSCSEVPEEATVANPMIFKRPSNFGRYGALSDRQLRGRKRPSSRKSGLSQFSSDSLVVPTALQVLVVDDYELNRFVLKHLLVKLGITVTEAADGQQAVLSVEEAHYDMIFMDLNMPVMNGLVAAQSIRDYERDHPRPRVPIIAVTAFEGSSMVSDCYKVGIDEVLIKPMTLPVLKMCLRRYLGRRKTRI